MTHRRCQRNIQILSSVIGIKELKFIVLAIRDIYKANWNEFCKLENRWTCGNLTEQNWEGRILRQKGSKRSENPTDLKQRIIKRIRNRQHHVSLALGVKGEKQKRRKLGKVFPKQLDLSFLFPTNPLDRRQGMYFLKKVRLSVFGMGIN